MTMGTARIHILVATVLMILMDSPVVALTISAIPGTAKVNQNVTINVTAALVLPSAVPPCPIEVNYGDGSPWIVAGNCVPLPTCSFSVNHAYTVPGTYTISGRTQPFNSNCTVMPYQPPDPVTGSIVITAACTPLIITTPSPLASGTVGQAFSSQLASSGGQAPVSYALSSGALPPGLTLGSSGFLSGVPTTVGNYPFTITATDSCPSGAQTSMKDFTVTINPASAVGTTDAAKPFAITRMEVFLINNHRGEMTVPRNTGGLRAGATILYTGSGLLKGYWEVDGRVISRIFRYINFGSTITLEMPEGVTLPTFDPGGHTAQFVIETPAMSSPLPKVIYYVTPDEKVAEIKLTSPLADTELPYAPYRFEWERIPSARFYQLRFLRLPEGVQAFSAYVTEPSYLLQELALKEYFTLGQYRWEVVALDASGRSIVASPHVTFSFKAALPKVPGDSGGR